MTPRGPDAFEHALADVASFLNGLPSPGMLIGGMAVIAHGHVRTTDDIDATISGDSMPVEDVVARAAAHSLIPRIDDVVAFARRTQVLLLTHAPTGTQLDLSLAWLPFEVEALARRTVVRLGDLELPVCGPEDLIVYKLVAGRPVDLDDVRQIALRHRDAIDRARVARTVSAFDEVLEDGRSRLELWREVERATFVAE